MKFKKLLAGILSAAIALSTMVMPVFADTPDEAFKAAFDAKASTITLTGDLTINATSSYNPVIEFSHNCTIDLAGHTLTKGDVTRIDIVNGANVKFTSSVAGAKINMGNTTDQTFLIKSGTLTFENITGDSGNIIHDKKDEMVFVDMQYSSGDATVNFDNCNMNLTGIGNVVRAAYGTENRTININDTIMESKRPVWGGNTCVVSGNSTIIGTMLNIDKIQTIGGDVTLPEGTVSTPVPVTVTDKNGKVSCFETFSDALAKASATDTLTMYADYEWTVHLLTLNTTINLNGYKLTLNDPYGYMCVKGDFKFLGDADRKSTLELKTTSANGDILFGIGYSVKGNNNIKMSGLTIVTPETYNATCGVIGVQGNSTLEMDNVEINVGSNNSNGYCEGIFYGNPGEKNVVILTDVDITAKNTNTVFYGFKDVDFDDVTFEGKVNEWIFSCVSGNIKNSSFTYTNTATESTTSIARDYADENVAYIISLAFENTVFNNVPECTEGIFPLVNESSVATGDENTEVISKANQTAFAAKVTSAAGADTMYPTLADAIANAKDGETVTLLTNLSGDGIGITENTFATGLIIDLGGYTYTVDGNLKGSGGSESNGFYFERGNKITIQNGTITSSKNATYYSTNDNRDYNTGILVQNHTETLTLKNVTLDGSNLRDEVFSYTLGNDNGTVIITNSKIIANTDGTKAFAFDADASGSSYNFTSVTIDKDSTVTGYIQVTNGGTITCDQTTYNTDGKYYKQGGKLVNMTSATTDRKIKAEASAHDVRAGEQFEVKVSIDADDIATAGFKLNYDPSLFRLVDDPTNNGEINFFDNASVFGGTYTNGAALATYTFEALAQGETKTGSFTLSNTRAYTYEENRLGMTFEVANTSDDVKISLNSFTATVKLDGKEVNGDSATLNYDGKEHKVVVSVEPTDYKSIEMTYTVDGKQKNVDPIIKEPGEYVITYNVETYDGYEPCSGTFTLTILEPNAYYVEVNTSVGKKADYVAGKKLVLVYTDLNNVAFKYNGKDMIEVTKSIGNYQYSGSKTQQTNFSHVYAYVAAKTTENTFDSYNALVSPFIMKDGYKIEKIDKYGFDINNNVGIDEQDPGTAIGVYGALDVYYENHDAQKNILKADVNGDKCVTQEDVAEVTLAAFNK